ncbi:unnamed protein product [Lactuca saligna]|uniref:Uncharacterized protein n=1 Tax=Lactuca saligna TaxID=75948 RepID=A0AA35Z941_LACSI|nr:unnamed protein product [Lactuca saligna]
MLVVAITTRAPTDGAALALDSWYVTTTTGDEIRTDEVVVREFGRVCDCWGLSLLQPQCSYSPVKLLPIVMSHDSHLLPALLPFASSANRNHRAPLGG